MKILIIITKGDVGGAQMYVLNLARYIKANNVDVHIGLGEEGKFLKSELDKSQIKYTYFQSLKRTHNPLKNLYFISEIKKFLNKNNFDAVHFNSSNALFGAIGAKLTKNKPKTIFTLHGLSLLDPNYETSKIVKTVYELLFKFLLCFIDEKIFVCKDNLEFAKKIKLVKNGNLIYNGLDPQDLKFEPKEESRNFLSQKIDFKLNDNFVLGSIGRLAYQKNYKFLINIFPQILKIKPNAILIIIGEGPEREKYENLIKELNLEKSVFLTGEIENASKYIKAFDLFVLPSRYEGLSITLIEMLFAGLPALISDVGGNREIVDNSRLQLYYLNDEKDFLGKFKQIVKDKNLYNKIKEQNLKYSSDFVLENVFKKYLEIIKKIK